MQHLLFAIYQKQLAMFTKIASKIVLLSSANNP